MEFTIPDSVSNTYGSNYCGKRSISLFAVSGDTNVSLAQQMLDNGDLTFTTSDGYALTL